MAHRRPEPSLSDRQPTQQVDWAAHEVKVGAEYDTRRAMLQARAGIVSTSRGGKGAPPPSLGRAGSGGGGNEGASEDAMENSGPSSTPWRSREKQVQAVRPL